VDWIPCRCEALYYVVTQQKTALWIPADVLSAIGAKQRDRLTPEQMAHPFLMGLLEQRREVHKKAR
jgi:hypothetical protein